MPAILLDAGKIDEVTLRMEVSRRLSMGMPAELGANWFAGLSMRNHYALIGRLTLWSISKTTVYLLAAVVALLSKK